jgi:hypothetical protein
LTTDKLKQRRFTGPAGPHYGNDFAAWNLDRYFIENSPLSAQVDDLFQYDVAVRHILFSTDLG